MPRLTPSEIAGYIARGFDPLESIALEEAISRVLVASGVAPFDADIEAESIRSAVLAQLRRMDQPQLLFEIAEHPSRLVGKSRRRQGDTQRTRDLRDALGFIPEVVSAVHSLGAETFVHVCRRMMAIHGAMESFITGNSDDGGIDLYGRLPLRIQEADVPASVVRTTPFNRDLLFLGQCKCYEPTSTIGRPKITDFDGAVAACMNKYEGNPRPPSRRVPPAYYLSHETALKIYFTTASYTSTAEDAAPTSDAILISGRLIAEFLVAQGVGISQDAQGTQVDAAAIATWARLP